MPTSIARHQVETARNSWLSASQLAIVGLFVASHVVFAQSQHTARELKLTSTCGELRLTAQADNAIRVRCGDSATTQLPELLFTAPAASVTTSVGSDARSSWLRTSQIKAVVDKRSGDIQFFDAKGKLLTQEVPGSRQLTSSTGSAGPVKTAEVQYALQPGEHLYGSGQFQDGYLDIARLPRKLVQLNTQISIPFLLSSNGYAILWHNYGMTQLNPPANHLVLTEAASGASQSVDVTTSAGTQRQVRRAKQFTGDLEIPTDGDYGIVLDSGRTMTDRYHLKIDGKTIFELTNQWLPGSTSGIAHLAAGTHDVTVEANADDHPSVDWGLAENKTVLISPDAREVDYTVFAGNADQVIGSYRRLTGEAPMFPEWAFGFIQCRERYHSSNEIIDTIQQFRKDDIPLDLIVQDWQYWGKYGWNAMRFDEANYPDPAALVKQVHDLNAKLMVSVWSRFDPASEVGKQFTEKNYYIPGTTWVDFFNPAAAKLYWQNFSSRMLSLGIDAWWLDATEPENDDLHNRTVYVGSGDEYRLVYPLYVTGTVYEGSRKDAPDKRVMILSRSAFLGEQRYSVSTWSGDIGNDWNTLRRQVTAGLDYAASGMPYWTTDTGGFFRPGRTQFTDPAYHERYVRWLEFSTFSPLMRVHGYQTNTEPWNYGPEMVKQEKDLIDLRYQLLPYIYSQAANVTSSGGTIMRPLVMDFADDPHALDQKYEYMFGPAFLVAPVLDAGVIQAHIYAPQSKGGWFNWWTGQPVAAGAEATVDAPIGKIPLLVRAGSIVPFAPVQQYVGEKQDSPLELRIYPGADGQFTLYDDDGLTYSYEQGQRSKVGIAWNEKTGTLTLGARQGTYKNMPSQQQLHVRLLRGQQWSEKDVTYTGRALSVRFEK
jgi:alpha-D-xyloside xylohydrolase